MSEEEKQNQREHQKNQVSGMSQEELQQWLEQVSHTTYENNLPKIEKLREW